MDEREVTTRKSFPTLPHPHGTLFALGLTTPPRAQPNGNLMHDAWRS